MRFQLTSIACLLLAIGNAGAGDDTDLASIGDIGVYTTLKKGKILSPAVSTFLAGYLSNVKNYRAHNLDLHYVQGEASALAKAAELGLDALLEARIQRFGENETRTKAELKLRNVATGEILLKWSATLEAPYFDPPLFQYIQPYGNLDQVFADWPVKTYQSPVAIRLLVVSDQRLRGSSGQQTKQYLLAQLETSSRILEREFGISLEVVQVKRWAAPELDRLPNVARAAAEIPGRDEVDLTLVCIGTPAPLSYWDGERAIGYARVLTNIVVVRRMNAHVFVHEIGHILGAVHIDQTGCIMRPMLETHAIDERFKILPPMLFSDTNRSIMNISKTVPLGAGIEDHAGKIAQLTAIYEGMRERRLVQIAPYYGSLLVALGRTDEAIELFSSALARAQNDQVIRSMLAEALEKAGRYAEAQQFVQEEFDIMQDQLKGITDGGLRLVNYAAIRLSASLLSFGQVPVGQRAELPLTIANMGTAMLELTNFGRLRSPYSVDDTAEGTQLKPGEAIEINVAFQPDEIGLSRGNLEIFSNARGQRVASVRLSGKGR